MNSTEISLNKRHDDNVRFEERVSRNLYAAINHRKK